MLFQAERTLPSSNLKPLNELETSRLVMAVSPNKMNDLNEMTQVDLLLRDLAAIYEFLFYMEAEPFGTPEKAENRKHGAFKGIVELL